MCVTEDKYELPIAVADTIPELARLTGATSGSIYSCLSKVKHGNANRSRYIKVVLDDEQRKRTNKNEQKNKADERTNTTNSYRTYRYYR